MLQRLSACGLCVDALLRLRLQLPQLVLLPPRPPVLAPLARHLLPLPPGRSGPPSQWAVEPHDPRALPGRSLDIRGADLYAYKVLRSGGRLGRAHSVVHNDFVTVKFFPADHYVSLMRKSAVAYGYFNAALPLLNDSALERALVAYNGPYKKNKFFHLRAHPLSTAVGRARLKKLVKSHLFEGVAAHRCERVKGLYFFLFRKVPVTAEDHAELRRSIVRGVEDVATSSSTQHVLQKLTADQNRANQYGRNLAKYVKFYNYVGAPGLPRYVPKLPFINDAVLR